MKSPAITQRKTNLICRAVVRIVRVSPALRFRRKREQLVETAATPTNNTFLGDNALFSIPPALGTPPLGSKRSYPTQSASTTQPPVYCATSNTTGNYNTATAFLRS